MSMKPEVFGRVVVMCALLNAYKSSDMYKHIFGTVICSEFYSQLEILLSGYEDSETPDIKNTTENT